MQIPAESHLETSPLAHITLDTVKKYIRHMDITIA